MSRGNVFRLVLAAAAVLTVGAMLTRLNRVTLPEGPVDIVWDREVCEHCKMHIGDPRFAAQLQATDGDLVSFDDPGCLVEYLQTHPTDVHALYFRDYDGDQWLSQAEAGFLPVGDSPMGYGIRAVSKETPGAHDWAWAQTRALERKQHEGGH